MGWMLNMSMTLQSRLLEPGAVEWQRHRLCRPSLAIGMRVMVAGLVIEGYVLSMAYFYNSLVSARGTMLTVRPYTSARITSHLQREKRMRHQRPRDSQVLTTSMSYLLSTPILAWPPSLLTLPRVSCFEI
jgi:hypothetical protein